jgi:hypothetical protein
MAKKRNAYRFWERKAEGRKSFGRPNRRWETIIKNQNYDGDRVPDLSGSGQEQVASFC